MMNSGRVFAVASKEWRLNLRFATEYFAGNLISPMKSAVLMLFIYSGFLKHSEGHFGSLRQDNYKAYVLLGTTCHSLFMASTFVFQSKMITEKWWQTVTATIISPASIFEVILGFIIGSGGLHVAIAMTFLTMITLFFGLSWTVVPLGASCLLLLACLGFGVGLIGATMSLCFEGRGYFYDYGFQAIVFLSCFYYPPEIMPEPLQVVAKCLPTYHLAQVLKQIFLVGYTPDILPVMAALTAVSFAVLVIPALFFEYSIKRYGIVGY